MSVLLASLQHHSYLMPLCVFSSFKSDAFSICCECEPSVHEKMYISGDKSIILEGKKDALTDFVALGMDRNPETAFKQ